MSQTTVNLGHVPVNRGEYSSSATYYKDNIVQYNGSSYICNVTEEDISHPTGISGITPYDSDPASPNTGWAVFANDSSGAGEGVYNVSVDHTTDNQPKIYASLSAALNDIPAAKKKGGMEIRFIFNNSNYAVDKEEGITTQPAGTLITSSPTMVDGTYKASQLLTYFSTLPTATGAGNAVVYYKEVDGTYTTWTITLQSSDNKYVQYRLMSDGWSINTNNWSFCGNSVYIENSEFVMAWLDAEDKVLWGIGADGNIFYGAGIPTQIKDYVDKQIADVSPKDYEQVLAFLDGMLGSDTTLRALLEGINIQIQKKVDKEEGKSLSTNDYDDKAKSFVDMHEETENSEYVKIITDSENKILQGIKKDGTFCVEADLEIGGNTNVSGDVIVDGDVNLAMQSIESGNNPKYLKVTTDSQGRILDGIKKDGSHYIGSSQEIEGDLTVRGIINNKEIQELGKTKELVDGQGDSDNIDSLEKVYDYLSGLPNELKGKRISILGDSISTFDGYIPTGYLTYYPSSNPADRSYDVRTVEDTWWKKVIDATESKLEVNVSYSGSTASTLLVGFSSRVPLLGSPDIIYIALGTNDSGRHVEVGDIDFDATSYDLSKFAPAYIKGIQDTTKTYPNAKIVCIAFDMNSSYYDAIKTIATHYGCTYIYVGDISNVHPNKAEMSAVAERIIKYSKYTLNDELKEIKGIAHFESNQNYIEITTDSENRVLEGITKDGKKQINIPVETPGATFEVINHPDYIKIEVDGKGDIINAIRKDGTAIVGGVDITKLKEEIDSNILAIEYDEETGDLYSITGESSTVDVTMDENGDIYVEQTI